jgi:hypothetical protein
MDNPYQKRGALASYEYYFLRKTTILGGDFIYFEQKSPLTYYQNSNFQMRPKRTLSYGQKETLRLEQILSANSKIKLSVFRGQKKHERPSHLGGEISLSNAFQKRWYFLLNSYTISENTSEPLLDDRGYYKSYGGSLQTTYEITYDLLCSLTYGLDVEEENDPRNRFKQRSGTDSYGIGVKYIKNIYSYRILAETSKNNIGSHHFYINLGLGIDF